MTVVLGRQTSCVFARCPVEECASGVKHQIRNPLLYPAELRAQLANKES